VHLTALQEVLQQTSEPHLGWEWLGWIFTVAAAGLGALIGSYLRKKGENLATREDIGKITREVEGIKAENAAKLQALDLQNQQILQQQTRKHQLELAALDKRLAAHQEAYALWDRLRRSILLRDPEKRKRIVSECQDWWLSHCLFLTDEAREAFRRALDDAEKLPDYIEARDQVKQRESWQTIEQVGKAIVEGVERTFLGEQETR